MRFGPTDDRTTRSWYRVGERVRAAERCQRSLPSPGLFSRIWPVLDLMGFRHPSSDVRKIAHLPEISTHQGRNGAFTFRLFRTIMMKRHVRWRISVQLANSIVANR